MANEVIGCALQGDDLATRKAEWATVTRHALIRETRSDRIVSTYPTDPEIVRELRRLIAAEAECCTFLKFSIEELPDRVVVELQLPDGMGESILGLLAPEKLTN